jgi:ubiquinone/menaquinone biosynthesis C-methylase UbiE
MGDPVAPATTMAERYDRRASTYGRCWAPVLRSSALALLDLVAPLLGSHGARLLDVGTGTGTLALAAVRRFPGVRVTAVDASDGMLARAREAALALEPSEAARLSFVQVDIVAEGERLDAAAFDAAVSSFVLQLVADRGAALRAIRRALRPEGLMAFVTWAGDSTLGAPEAAWAEACSGALRAAKMGAPRLPDPPRAGPFTSQSAAAAEFRDAGFAAVVLEPTALVHDLGRAGALAQLVEYDHADELGALPATVRADAIARLDPLLAALPDEAFEWRAPLLQGLARAG